MSYCLWIWILCINDLLGADIANVCNEAALHGARSKQKFVTGADLEYAVERVVGGTEKRSHAMSPAEKRVVSDYIMIAQGCFDNKLFAIRLLGWVKG